MVERKAIVLGMDGMQLPLVRRFSKEGVMPNLAWMMKQGSCGQLLPSIPAYTPTNWAAISTGASPGTTGLAGWYVRKYGDPWEKGLSAFDSRAISAETIMEAADRQGLKVLAIFYPNTWPPKLKRGYVVSPFYSGKGVLPISIAGPAVYSTDVLDKNAVTIKLCDPSSWADVPDGQYLASEIVVAPEQVPLVADYDADEKVALDIEKRRSLEPLRLYLLVRMESPFTLSVCRDKDVKSEITRSHLGEWSSWCYVDLGEVRASMRFKLLKVDPPTGLVRIVRSQVYPTRGFAHPEELCAEIVEEVGPFIERPSTGAGIDAETCFEDFLYQGLWMARVASHLKKTRGWDLYIHHYHILDSISHGFLAQSDPSWPFYDEERAKVSLDVLRRSYEIVDQVVGEFRKLQDEDTYLVVISDHGNAPNSWICNTVDYLREKGLICFKPDGAGGETIDWKRSKTYMIPQRQLEIFVNLKGRDFAGCVDPSDYEKVQEEVVDALYDWKEPTTGKRPIALALKKRDAAVLGFWGDEECGDVVFVYNSGFGRGRPEGGPIAPAYGGGANHGPQMPTTQTGFSSNLASLFIVGPSIKRGYSRDEKRFGPWRIIDFAPTLSYLLGIEPPKNSEGGVMRDILEGEA